MSSIGKVLSSQEMLLVCVGKQAVEVKYETYSQADHGNEAYYHTSEGTHGREGGCGSSGSGSVD